MEHHTNEAQAQREEFVRACADRCIDLMYMEDAGLKAMEHYAHAVAIEESYNGPSTDPQHPHNLPRNAAAGSLAYKDRAAMYSRMAFAVARG